MYMTVKQSKQKRRKLVIFEYVAISITVGVLGWTLVTAWMGLGNLWVHSFNLSVCSGVLCYFVIAQRRFWVYINKKDNELEELRLQLAAEKDQTMRGLSELNQVMQQVNAAPEERLFH